MNQVANQPKIRFRDEKGNLKPELLTIEAEKEANTFFNPPSRDKKLTPAQLRIFYNEVKSLEAKINATGFEKNKALFYMLKAKAAYACPQTGTKKIPKEFKNFIDKCVDSVKNEQDFKDFVLFFEAVVAYFYSLAGRN